MINLQAYILTLHSYVLACKHFFAWKLACTLLKWLWHAVKILMSVQLLVHKLTTQEFFKVVVLSDYTRTYMQVSTWM